MLEVSVYVNTIVYIHDHYIYDTSAYVYVLVRIY